MSIAASTRTPGQAVGAFTAVFVTLGGLACSLTLLFLGMRAIMDIGGACASGGPFVPRVECPEGAPLLMVAGIFGGLISAGLYVWATLKHRVPSLVGLAWPALFLSLGWNFLDYGLNPPFGEGLVWGWLICAIVFALMGGLPLLVMVKPMLRSFGGRGPGIRPPTGVFPTISKLNEVRTQYASRARTGPSPGTSRREDESVVDALERLSTLHASGALTDREFEEAKRRILRGEA